MNRRYKEAFICLISFVFIISFGSILRAESGNTSNDSFQRAKNWLLNDVYKDHHTTIYCGATFTADKRIIPLTGFHTERYQNRADKLEWEHIVPAENFGRTFPEWREGHPTCLNAKNEPFKGRKCAELANREYRLMQADMYNLYPAIGAVNAARQNYNFTQFQDDMPSSFGTCLMKIQDRKVEPPAPVRGIIARTYLYFESAYPRYHMSASQRQLMQAWDSLYPVDSWECDRACRIYQIQKNENEVLRTRCQERHPWSCEGV